MIFKNIIDSITSFTNNAHDVSVKIYIIAKTEALIKELEHMHRAMSLGFSEDEAKEKLNIEDDIEEIFLKLQELNPDSAMTVIKNYLQKHEGVVLCQNSQLKDLKLELQEFEKKLQTSHEKKVKCIKSIDKFNKEHHLKLGSLIKEILKLKEDISQKELENIEVKYNDEKSLHVDTRAVYKEVQKKMAELEELLEDIDEDDERYEEINQVNEELKENLIELRGELKNQKENLRELEDKKLGKAKKAYEKFSKEYEDINKELKKPNRNESRVLYHHIAEDNLDKQAHNIMQEIDEAYNKKDLKRVKNILKNLENGIAIDIVSNNTKDKKILKDKIEELREKTANTNKALKTIKQNDTFKTISGLDDWNEYFESMKYALEEEKESLMRGENIIEDKPSIKKIEIKVENSNYSKKLQGMQLPTFEKIRRYCSNLVDKDSGDELNTYLAENGKMHKALIYSAFDEFLERVEGKTINIVDWECGQGMSTMIMLDYIREKQLDIKVSDVVLIAEDEEQLSRAMLHVDVMKNESLHVTTITEATKDDVSLDNDNQTIFLGIMSYNETYLKLMTKSNSSDYYVFIDIEYDEIIDEICGYLKNNFDIESISQKDGKIGRYHRFEDIFTVEKKR